MRVSSEPAYRTSTGPVEDVPAVLVAALPDPPQAAVPRATQASSAAAFTLPRLRDAGRPPARSCDMTTRGPYRWAGALSSAGASGPLGEDQPAVGGVVDGGAAPAGRGEEPAHGALRADVVRVELPAVPPGEGG